MKLERIRIFTQSGRLTIKELAEGRYKGVGYEDGLYRAKFEFETKRNDEMVEYHDVKVNYEELEKAYFALKEFVEKQMKNRG